MKPFKEFTSYTSDQISKHKLEVKAIDYSTGTPIEHYASTKKPAYNEFFFFTKSGDSDEYFYPRPFHDSPQKRFALMLSNAQCNQAQRVKCRSHRADL